MPVQASVPADTEREPSVDEFGRQFVGEMIGPFVMTNGDEPVVLQEVVDADRPLAFDVHASALQ
ncbi:hypothetical protein VP03_27625 [Sinorhizobium meliloti]|nr:hypothetical protein VP03_27625 [Sinorhizobium meliloti]